MIPEKHFFLIEKIKNIAGRLTSIGPRSIIGNARADALANSAQQLATDLDTTNNITDIRHKILSETASLVSNIDILLSCKSPSLRWPVFG